MSENNLWAKVRRNMVGPYWQEAQRHEDKLDRGIADVSFSQRGRHGWVELKWATEWPAREATILRLDHYTDEQRAFLESKGKGGGNTWLLLQVYRDHLLFNWPEAIHSVGRVNKMDLIEAATGYWSGHLNYQELSDLMIQFRDAPIVFEI